MGDFGGTAKKQDQYEVEDDKEEDEEQEKEEEEGEEEDVKEEAECLSWWRH